MNVRLIKADTLSREQEVKRRPDEIPIIDTIRSWVREFQVTRPNRVRLDLERISAPGKK